MTGPPKEVEGGVPHHQDDRPSTHDFSSRQATHRGIDSSAPTAETSVVTGSQQVAWYETHLFLEAVLAQANLGPLAPAGSPQWCELSDGDPRKLLSLAVDGVHHVLRKSTSQEALADASRAVSAAADWSKIAREMQQCNDFHASKPWLRRRALP